MNIDNFEKNIKAAGIVIYFDNTNGFDKDNEKEILYLCLLDRKKGQYDFPKGCIDFNEEVLSCAVRETKEETSLTISKDYMLDDHEYKIFANGLAMYSARYIDLNTTLKNFSLNKSKKIKIVKNPVTNYYEHDGFVWLSYDKVVKNILPYLQEVIIYYNGKIKSNKKYEKQ